MNTIKNKIKIFLLGIIVPGIIYVTINAITVLIMHILYDYNSLNIIVVQGIANFFSILALYPYYLLFKREFLIVTSNKMNFKNVIYIIAISFSLCIILNVLIELIPRDNENVVTKNVELLLNELNPIFPFIIVSIIVPLIEELLFRGFFYDSVKTILNDIFAIILTSLLFGLVHTDLQQIIYAFAVGIFLGFVRYKFNTIIYPIVVHATMNTTSLLIISEIGKDIRSILFALFISIVILIFSIVRLTIKNND